MADLRKFRLKNNRDEDGVKRKYILVDGVFRVGWIDNGRFVQRVTPQTDEWLAKPGNREALMAWIAEKTAALPVVDWPPTVPMGAVPPIAVAFAPPGTIAREPWYYWRTITHYNDWPHPYAGWRVMRSDAGIQAALPAGWVWGEPLTISQRDAAKYEAQLISRAIADNIGLDRNDDDYIPVPKKGSMTIDKWRSWRGDPYSTDGYLLEAPLTLNDPEAEHAAMLHIDSSPYHTIVVREYKSNEGQPERWTASTGTGGYMQIVPGPSSYGTMEESLMAAEAWRRKKVVDQIDYIAERRGGTCAWGWAIKVAIQPTIYQYDWQGREIVKE